MGAGSLGASTMTPLGLSASWVPCPPTLHRLQDPGDHPADRYMVYSLGAPELGSEPFFFPKFPVQSTVSLWMTTADMAARPGADMAWRRIP